MRDRTPTRALENGALRYGVYAEDGSLLRYEYLALEDDPTDPGTELRKATLLQDSTEVSLFGSAADRTVDDAFAGIAGQLKLIKSDMAAITLTVQDTNGKPIPEVLVQGILSESGQAVYTNANGVVTGYIGEGQQPIKVTGYADIEDYVETLTVVKGTTITKTIKPTTRNFLRITASKSVIFSGNVKTVDVNAVGGGGGGGYGAGSYRGSGGGGGGGGGHSVIQTGIAVESNTPYPCIVGAGGESRRAEKATDGGKSSFLNVQAYGGGGGQYAYGTPSGGAGSGNGNGGAGNGGSDSAFNGSAGTEKGFLSFSESGFVGGGGGGGSGSDSDGNAGSPGTGGGYGGDGGGDSGLATENDGNAGTNGYGGGGGGGGSYLSNLGAGGRGGSGCVAIRMHLKSAA